MSDVHPKISVALGLLATGGAAELAEAVALLRRIVLLRPGESMALAVLAEALSRSGMHVQAADAARRALAAMAVRRGYDDDERGFVAQRAGLALCNAGSATEAVAVLSDAARLVPDATSFDLLAAAEMGAGNLIRAESAARLALACDPGHTGAAVKTAASLLERGLADAASEVVRASIAMKPDDGILREMLPPALNYGAAATPQKKLEAAREFADRLCSGRATGRFKTQPRATSAIPRRIGILSSDLKTHSVAYFVAPLLAHGGAALGNADGVRVFSTAPTASLRSDPVSGKLRSLLAADAWTDAGELTDAELADAILAAQIDVLVDCSGLTVGHRCGALARLLSREDRPRIVTWLGYPATTGLALDGRIVDAVSDAAGTDEHYSERLIRMDGCFVCYQPPEHRPPARSTGAPVNPGAIRFGSFNSLSKLSGRCVRLMAEVLTSVLPNAAGSTLTLKAAALRDPMVRDEVRSRFAECGVGASALNLVPPDADLRTHLGRYQNIDIALDTTPYCGTTTTCEALVQGVPVVTLAEPEGQHASRVGASLLSAAGLGPTSALVNLVATDRAGFVRTAAALAANSKLLTTLHHALPAQVAGSTLCDGVCFATRFVAALAGDNIARAHEKARRSAGPT